MELPPRSETPRPRHRKDESRQASLCTPKRTARQRSLTEVLLAMDLLQNTTAVLITDLDPTWVSRNDASEERDAAKAYVTLKATSDRLQHIEGLYIEGHAINPDSRDNINDLKRKIRDGTGPEGGNKAWDGVLFGTRVRCDVQRTHMFEELVNFVHDTLPGVKLLFASNDEDHAEVIRRHLNIGPEKIPLTKTALEAMNRGSSR
ncbi:hypothetical protein CERZMDRAFT_81509 [Cercospora zeae-maydis SCOH1-5]|uniref:Uncharacterized protein n=1 Tax=Cercospora zeae-maydis SCOH1-5 TaxID=717836 RepID=A0A6A6FSJ9_9PEZI|nr:hypothetical protein CERZMDRAFT_81509 [Cercospora zeae-maydis SCOH1-5]